MSIRIVTRSMQAAGGEGETKDSYLEKVVKYIPSEVVTAWMFAKSMIKVAEGQSNPALLWTAFGFGLLITAALKYKQTRLPLQVAVSTGAFAVWVFALGEPLASTPVLQLYGTLSLVGYTLVTSLVNPD
jgi:FtsH-binding integral membrane protein